MKKTEGQSPFRAHVLIVVVALVVAFAALALALVANENRIAGQNGEYLASSTEQTAQRVNGLFEDALRDVQTAAGVFEESLDNTDIEPAEAAKVLDLPQFDHTFFITPRGVAFKPDGTTGVATEKFYYTQGIQGSSGICYIADALFDGESVVAFFTPVRFEGREAGVAVCAYRESTLASYMTATFSGQQMPTYLCEADGMIIASAVPEDTKGVGSGKYMGDVFAGVTLEGASVEKVAGDLESGGSVGFTYGSSEGTVCAHATKLASIDWVVMRVFPASVMGTMVAEANGASVLLAACLIVVAAVALALLLRQKRDMGDVGEMGDMGTVPMSRLPGQGAGGAGGAADAGTPAKPHASPEVPARLGASASGGSSAGSPAADATNAKSGNRDFGDMGTVPMSPSAGTRVESVFANSLTKDVRSHTELTRGKPEEVDAEEAARQEAERLAQEQERLKGLGYQGKRILLTEDNAMATSIAKELLELTGAEVEHAENGQKAVDMLLGHDPGYYDIVLMDIQMPVMNGYDATRAIRAAAAERADLGNLPVIALSADMFADDIRNSQDAGMNDHIAKPLKVGTLVGMLQKWMG